MTVRDEKRRGERDERRREEQERNVFDKYVEKKE